MTQYRTRTRNQDRGFRHQMAVLGVILIAALGIATVFLFGYGLGLTIGWG